MNERIPLSRLTVNQRILLLRMVMVDEGRSNHQNVSGKKEQLISRGTYLYENLDPTEETSSPGMRRLPGDRRKAKLADRSNDEANMCTSDR